MCSHFQEWANINPDKSFGIGINFALFRIIPKSEPMRINFNESEESSNSFVENRLKINPTIQMNTNQVSNLNQLKINENNKESEKVTVDSEKQTFIY